MPPTRLAALLACLPAALAWAGPDDGTAPAGKRFWAPDISPPDVEFPQVQYALDELAKGLLDLHGFERLDESENPNLTVFVTITRPSPPPPRSPDGVVIKRRESRWMETVVISEADDAYELRVISGLSRPPRPCVGGEDDSATGYQEPPSAESSGPAGQAGRGPRVGIATRGLLSLPDESAGIVIEANTARGAMLGLLHANTRLYESWATGRAWPDPLLNLQRSPQVALRGIYTHLLYGHAYPWAPRGWSTREHRLFLEMLAGLGYNVQMVTPGIGVMETPLTDLAKEGLDVFLQLRGAARRDLGMEMWPGDAANEVTYKEDPVPLFERGLGSAEWVNPGDPERLRHILDNRQELFRYWPDLDAFWVIDGDPGGYPGSPAQDFVALLLGLRDRMDRAHPEGKSAALVYWQWTTWSPDLDENTGIPVLRMLEERMQGRWYVMVSNESSLRNAREADVLDHAIYFPYHLVEFEPHGPFTNPRFEDIRTEVNRGIEGDARRGAFCNAMSPLIQLPNIAYFGECLWHPAAQQPEGATVMRRLAAQVIPEHSDVLAAAWLALEADPSSALVPQAKEALDAVLAEDSLGIIGPVGRRWFPSVRFHLECLSKMLGVHALAGPARDAIREHGFRERTVEDALTAYIRAYLEWNKVPQFYHPRRFLSGRGYHWINFEIIEQVRNRPNGEAEAREMLRSVEDRCRAVFPAGAEAAVRQISRGVVNFDDPAESAPSPDWQTGDIIVIDVSGEFAEVIRGMTHSPYTHCGLVRKTEEDGILVIEAVDPVRVVPLDTFLAQARGGHYVHLRVPALPDDRVDDVIAEAEKHFGKPYDHQVEWGDDRMYCSELTYKAYQRGAGILLGTRHRIGDMDWQPYKEFIRGQAGGDLPLDREVITPAELVRTPWTTILANTFPGFGVRP